MSTYFLTEAYKELHNPRLTESNYYDNLRFVDYLAKEDIQQVMESLLFEFMDYGDTLEEAYKLLETVFSDDHIICESIDLICEARVDMAARREQRMRRAEESAKTSKMKAQNIARARRAERAAAIRGALRGAKEAVKGTLSAAHKKVTDMRSQLAAKGASAALRGQAALTKLARVARGSVKGAIEGARKEYQTPSKAPSSRIPGRQRTQQARAAAKKAIGRPFDAPQPKAEIAKQKLLSMSKTRAALPPSGKSSGSTKGGRVLTASQRKMKNDMLSKRLNSDVDYDLLTQHMIEDIINAGYAINEESAISILENMSTETFNELVEEYLKY